MVILSMPRKAPVLKLAALGCLLALAACGGDGLSRTFGLSHAAPDEFTVTTRAPLSMPPDFELRPPQPGQPRPQENSAAKGAEATLVPQTALAQPSSGADSAGQQALLQAAGPRAPADIRSKVAADSAADAQDQSLTDRLLFWRPPAAANAAVDPQKESERLKQNAAVGDSPATGDTPVIKRGPRSVFDWLF